MTETLTEEQLQPEDAMDSPDPCSDSLFVSCKHGFHVGCVDMCNEAMKQQVTSKNHQQETTKHKRKRQTKPEIWLEQNQLAKSNLLLVGTAASFCRKDPR